MNSARIWTRLPLNSSFLALALLATAAQAAVQPVDRPIDGSYIVGLRADAGTQSIGAPRTTGQLASDLSGFYGGQTARIYTKAFQGFAFRGSSAAADNLSRDPRVAYVAQDGVVTLSTVQTPTPSWGLDRIDQRDGGAQHGVRLPLQRRGRRSLHRRHRHPQHPRRLRRPGRHRERFHRDRRRLGHRGLPRARYACGRRRRRLDLRRGEGRQPPPGAGHRLRRHGLDREHDRRYRLDHGAAPGRRDPARGGQHEPLQRLLLPARGGGRNGHRRRRGLRRRRRKRRRGQFLLHLAATLALGDHRRRQRRERCPLGELQLR